MDTDEISLMFDAPHAALSRPDVLVAAVMHLMSNYTVNASGTGACLRLAAVIERHLKALADMSDLAPVLRATCQQLSGQWAALVERSMPQHGRPSLLTRRRSLTTC
jgi:hypothetical protein